MTEPTAHERALELAVAALDFHLDPTERAWLDHHLAGCAACRARSLAYAVDARGLERLPQVSAPKHVRGRILRGSARSGPPGLGRRSWLATAAALGVAAALGGAMLLRPGDGPTGPGMSMAPSGSAGASGTASGVTPSESASASASDPAAVSDPPTAPVSGPLAWEPVAVPSHDGLREVRALSGGAGMAVATLVGANGEPRLWWSRDGGAWSDAELPVGAFGGSAPWLVEPFGAGFVALGWTDVTQSATERRIWVSPDGLAWRPDVEASGRLGPIEYGLLSATDTIALAVGRSQAGETMAWRSTDGETWTRLQLDRPVREAELDGLAAADDGFLAFGRADGAPRVWRTVDGATWVELVAPPGLASVQGLSASVGGYQAWGATGIERRTPNALAWSPDGRRWEAVAPPAPVTADDQLAWITYDGSGLIAQWRRLDRSTVLGRSPDGRRWTAVGAEGLPAGAQLDQVVRVGERLVALGRDGDGAVVSFTATP